MTAVVEMLDPAEIARLSRTSLSTVNRAMNKWKSGIDDGNFPPPLAYKRKGDGAKATRMSTSTDYVDWLERWPD